jgi:hypothetical protein
MSEKKPRSAAQVAAFEKAKAAREGNLRRKFMQEQEAEKSQQQPKEDEDEDGDSESPAKVDEEHMSRSAPAPAQHTPYVEDFQPIYDTPAQPPKGRSRKQAPPAYDDDIIELDTDALFSTLESQKQELKELREHIHGLRQGHEELQSTWQQHDVSRRTELSFV